MIDLVEAKKRVVLIREELSAMGGQHVQIIAVTKSFPGEAMKLAIASGCDGIGENYAQELLSKSSEIPNGADVHFIGALQTNKVRQIASFVTCWQSVDRESVVAEIAKRAPGARILLQVNTTGEETKGGVVPRGLDQLRTSAQSAGLVVEGLMTIGPTGGSYQESEESFALLRSLVDEHGLAVCSMGMSDDFTVAVECGTTMIRIGRRLLGERPASS